jgi:hypothetical protein
MMNDLIGEKYEARWHEPLIVFKCIQETFEYHLNDKVKRSTSVDSILNTKINLFNSEFNSEQSHIALKSGITTGLSVSRCTPIMYNSRNGYRSA